MLPTDPLQKRCCLCGCVRLPDGRWVSGVPEAEKVTHGYCPTCARKILAALRQRQVREKPVTGSGSA